MSNGKTTGPRTPSGDSLRDAIDRFDEFYMDPPDPAQEFSAAYAYSALRELIGISRALLAALELRGSPVAILQQTLPVDPVLAAYLDRPLERSEITPPVPPRARPSAARERDAIRGANPEEPRP